jgi:nitrogen PTS system EIIA component
MELVDLLSEESVVVVAAATSKDEVLHRLAERAAEVTGQSKAAIYGAVSDREALGSTGLGNGIAIPHGKLAGLAGVTAIFARLEQPVDFEAVDDQPVDLVMMLLAPLGAGADHLKALARVARLLRDPDVARKLRESRDAEALYAVLALPPATAA